ncbi:hypothetical protein CHUAL_004560 [Chamberlinius hualienensis]
MAPTVTITRTTTTSTSSVSYIICNTDFLKSIPGILKLIETVINIICVGIMSYYINHSYFYSYEMFFVLVACTFLITTAIMLFSCIVSLVTSKMLPKTMFHYLYHAVGFLLYLSAGLTLVIKVSNRKHYADYEPKIAAGVLGLVNSILYLLSGILSFRTFYIVEI